MATRHQHPNGIYVDDILQDSVPQRQNLPSEERLVRLLRCTIDTCKEVFQDHGAECNCDFCIDVQGVLWSVRIFESSLESELFTVHDGPCPCPACGHAVTPGNDSPAADSAPAPAPDNPFYAPAPR